MDEATARDRRRRTRTRAWAGLVALLLLADLGGGVRAAADPLAAIGAVLTERGKEAPDFTLPDPEGKRVRLHNFQGKIVLLTFFTTW